MEYMLKLTTTQKKRWLLVRQTTGRNLYFPRKLSL